jgi:hypothetical protein
MYGYIYRSPPPVCQYTGGGSPSPPPRGAEERIGRSARLPGQYWFAEYYAYCQSLLSYPQGNKLLQWSYGITTIIEEVTNITAATVIFSYNNVKRWWDKSTYPASLILHEILFRLVTAHFISFLDCPSVVIIFSHALHLNYDFYTESLLRKTHPSWLFASWSFLYCT